MNPATGWRRYVSPLNLAAYGALLAVVLAMLRRPAHPLAMLDLDVNVGWILVLTVFLLGFWWATVWSQPRTHAGVGGIALMAGATLLLVSGDVTNTVGVLLVILASVVTLRWPLGQAIMLLAALNIALLWVINQHQSLVSAAVFVAIYGGFQAFAAIASFAFRRAELIADSLRTTNAHLLATRSLLSESARDGERLRLSRELHDVSGHKLTAIKLNLALLAQDAALRDRSELTTASALATELLDDLRGVVSQLRHHDGIDLRAALEGLAAVIPRPRVSVAVEAEARIANAERAVDVLRIAQEALTNAVRHSNAGEISLTLVRDADDLLLTITDDGPGDGLVIEGHGITGMRERALALGGELALTPRRGGGLVVTLRVPRATLA